MFALTATSPRGWMKTRGDVMDERARDDQRPRQVCTAGCGLHRPVTMLMTRSKRMIYAAGGPASPAERPATSPRAAAQART